MKGQLANLQKERTLSDTELIAEGAQYVKLENESLVLRVTDRQIKGAEAEMNVDFCKRELAGIVKRFGLEVIGTALSSMLYPKREERVQESEDYAPQPPPSVKQEPIATDPIADAQKERTQSDAAFLNGGAQYVELENESLVLQVTDEQIKGAEAEMNVDFCKRELAGIIEKFGASIVRDALFEFQQAEREVKNAALIAAGEIPLPPVFRIPRNARDE